MVSPNAWIMIKGINQSIMKTATLNDMQGEEESGEHEFSVPPCETVKETLNLKCFEEAPNKKSKMMMTAKPREKSPGKDIKSKAVSFNWNKKRLGEFPWIKVNENCYNITKKTLVEVYILPAKEQIHRFGPKKIYGLEVKPHSKKAKEHRYIKDCKEKPREIREQASSHYATLRTRWFALTRSTALPSQLRAMEGTTNVGPMLDQRNITVRSPPIASSF